MAYPLAMTTTAIQRHESARIYTYNQNQRLIQVVDGAMTANYTYNGNGQRVKKSVNGTMTIFPLQSQWTDHCRVK